MGIFIIYIANILRLAALAVMNMHQMVAVNIAHHYVFKIIVYECNFLKSKKELIILIINSLNLSNQ